MPTGPAGRSVLPADRAPWHPLARLGAFVVGVGVGGVVMQGVVYQPLAAALAAVGVRPQLGEWLFAAGVLAASWLAVRVAEPRRLPLPEALASTGAAYRPRTLALGAAAGALPIAAVLAGLIGLGAYRIEAGAEGSVLQAALLALAVLVPAALAEELLVRGYAWTVLRGWLGGGVATVATAVVFTALHGLNPGADAQSATCVFLAGVLLALVRWRTDSLPAAFVAHLAWNVAIVVVAHAPVSGLAFPTPAWRLVADGPAWLTGGAWGPEGSILTAAALAAAIAVLWRGVSAATASHTSFARLGRA